MEDGTNFNEAMGTMGAMAAQMTRYQSRMNFLATVVSNLVTKCGPRDAAIQAMIALETIDARIADRQDKSL